MSTLRTRSGGLLLAAALLGLAITTTHTTSAESDAAPLGPDTAVAVEVTRGSPAAVADLAAARPGAAPATEPDVARARELLAALPVRVEDTGAHYDRDQWGDWTTGVGGCDTREIVLIRDGRDVERGPGCRVMGGIWISPYDGAHTTTPSRVQIDHRVPLAEAQRSGARHWSRAQRVAFYNDPANLVAVSARANTSKGDQDPGQWRPTRRDAWCGYAAAYITTKHTWRLHIDPAEHAGLVAMLNTCPGGHR